MENIKWNKIDNLTQKWHSNHLEVLEFLRNTPNVLIDNFQFIEVIVSFLYDEMIAGNEKTIGFLDSNFITLTQEWLEREKAFETPKDTNAIDYKYWLDDKFFEVIEFHNIYMVNEIKNDIITPISSQQFCY